MEETIQPDPPHLAGLVWRTLGRGDLQAVVELSRLCYLADGGLGFLFTQEPILDRFFPDAPGAAVGAFDPVAPLAACAAVHIAGEPGAQRAVITGMVRPDLRSRGIGGYLMRWSQAQALALFADVPEGRRVLQVSTESLTEPADRLYRRQGFERVFDELVMERDLRLPLPERLLPPGVTLASWQPDLAEQFFQAYHAAFQERPGFPGWSAAQWIGYVTENDHIPEWSLLAHAEGEPAGFVIGNVDLTTDPPGGYVWQIGVVPAQRRRGLASTLLVETMRRMQTKGALSALLTVHTNNPGAIEAYRRIGFKTVGRRARYERSFASKIAPSGSFYPAAG